MGYPKQEYWSGLPFPSPGDLPNPETKPVFPALADGFSLPLSHLGSHITMAWRSKDPGCHYTHLFLGQKHWHRHTVQFNSVQLLSCVWLFATPRTAARQASLSITNSWSLLKLMSVESVMPSNHLILCCPLLCLPSIFPSTRVFSKESVLCIRWPKYWSFSFSISPLHDHVQNRQPVGSCWITQGAQPSAPWWPRGCSEREVHEGGDRNTLQNN